MIDLGDVHPLTVDLVDADGNPANATSVALTIILPDLTTVTPVVSNPSTGRYQYDYVTTQAGLHRVRWSATGANTSSYPESFNVAEANPAYIISLAAAKAHLNITSTADDEELRGFIEAATPVVEDVVGPVVVRTYADVDSHGGPFLVLANCPVVSLTSLAAVLTSGTSYEVDDLDLDGQNGIVRRLDGGRFCGPLRITYKAGRAVVPANITQAAKEIVRHMWETQRGHSGARPGFGEEGFVQTGSGFTIPRRVMELLVPHRRAPLVA